MAALRDMFTKQCGVFFGMSYAACMQDVLHLVRVPINMRMCSCDVNENTGKYREVILMY